MPANLGFPRSKVVVSSEQSGGLLEAKWQFVLNCKSANCMRLCEFDKKEPIVIDMYLSY